MRLDSFKLPLIRLQPAHKPVCLSLPLKGCVQPFRTWPRIYFVPSFHFAAPFAVPFASGSASPIDAVRVSPALSLSNEKSWFIPLPVLELSGPSYTPAPSLGPSKRRFHVVGNGSS